MVLNEKIAGSKSTQVIFSTRFYTAEFTEEQRDLIAEGKVVTLIEDGRKVRYSAV